MFIKTDIIMFTERNVYVISYLLIRAITNTKLIYNNVYRKKHLRNQLLTYQSHHQHKVSHDNHDDWFCSDI
jgi:hypothetical protein